MNVVERLHQYILAEAGVRDPKTHKLAPNRAKRSYVANLWRQFVSDFDTFYAGLEETNTVYELVNVYLQMYANQYDDDCSVHWGDLRSKWNEIKDIIGIPTEAQEETPEWL